jgi:hypothetical protein
MDRLTADPRRVLLACALIACALLAASCTPDPVYAHDAEQAVEQATAQVREAVAAPAVEAQVSVAEVAVPAVVGVREIVQDVLPPPAEPVDRAMGEVSPAAVALIVGFEITSPAYYQARLQGVACPPKASGPTIGVGYDLGHQTAHDIRRDWAAHPMVDTLATASGVAGPDKCRAWRAANPGVRVPLEQASQVFEAALLPRYHASARRALHNGWDRLPWDGQGGMVSLGFNRGWAMTGGARSDPRREMRALRDTCVPSADVHCMAAELRGMKRLWRDVPGLQRRREAEAVLVENAS